MPVIMITLNFKGSAKRGRKCTCFAGQAPNPESPQAPEYGRERRRERPGAHK